MLRSGTKLNGVYTLLGEIGSGGGGTVYKAYHENLKKYVVVKQINDIAKEVLDTRAEADILKNLRNSCPRYMTLFSLKAKSILLSISLRGNHWIRLWRERGKLIRKRF